MVVMGNPKPVTGNLNTRLPQRLIDRLDKASEDRELGRAWIVRHALERYLDELDERAPIPAMPKR